MQNQNVLGVDFISSFGGSHSYLIRARSGNRRVEVHYPASDYHRSISCYKDADYEKHVISCIGCYTGASEVHTLDVAVEFNRHRFAHLDAQVATILANPLRYGEYDPFASENLFTVFLPAKFDENHGWQALYGFEQIRDLAGIPADRCTSLYQPVAIPTANKLQAA